MHPDPVPRHRAGRVPIPSQTGTGDAGAAVPVRRLLRNHRRPAGCGGQARQNACITPTVMSFFRSTLLPAAIVLIFGLALFAVSARIWLPGDMAAPAPIN